MEWNGFFRGNGRGIPLGRRRAPEQVAFVLSGGGVLGAVQVGQVEALLRSGIVPDLLVGASVGALNASAIACDPSVAGAEQLRDVWLSLRAEDIFPGSRMQRAWHFVRRGDHLYPNTGLRRLAELLPARRFEEMQRPLHVEAVNLRTGKEHWFESGAVVPAILASTAIPGIFPPVVVDGELYVDGGVVNNVPVSRAIELGATRVYVLTCGSGAALERQMRRPLDVLLTAVVRSRAAKVEVDIARFSAQARIDVLPSPETGLIRYNDTSHTARLVAEARDLTAAYLDRAATAAAR
jgi:NTE family protein